MEETYWKRFLETGKITDYLYYKGMAICKNVMDSHERGENGESNHSDGHGDCCSIYR